MYALAMVATMSRPVHLTVTPTLLLNRYCILPSLCCALLVLAAARNLWCGEQHASSQLLASVQSGERGAYEAAPVVALSLGTAATMDAPLPHIIYHNGTDAMQIMPAVLRHDMEGGVKHGSLYAQEHAQQAQAIPLNSSGPGSTTPSSLQQLNSYLDMLASHDTTCSPGSHYKDDRSNITSSAGQGVHQLADSLTADIVHGEWGSQGLMVSRHL